jgi:hypothetical protein
MDTDKEGDFNRECTRINANGKEGCNGIVDRIPQGGTGELDLQDGKRSIFGVDRAYWLHGVRGGFGPPVAWVRTPGKEMQGVF